MTAADPLARHLAFLRWLVASEIHRRAQAGRSIPMELRAAERDLTSALSVDGQAGVPPGEESEWITSTEAAHRLGCTERTVRRHGPRLGGRKVGRSWIFRADAVAEHAGGSTP
ncbi:helix-turn-helix domain-containing protein [Nocardia sp. NPDC057227]|uniref:helix-turn-helix domain-containing protein n=1 Tax=Nocardia sp. NPDC057227 TaxID=3346056 RepID=UPI00363A0326